MRAAEAVELFCYQTRKWHRRLRGRARWAGDAGILRAASASARPKCAPACAPGLEFLGIEIDAARNAALTPSVISTAASRVTVRVIPTDEERMIAQSVGRLINR